MAGSYRHIIGRTGKFLNNENFVQMIENLGDAYETAEECYGMIWWLANAMAERGPGVQAGSPSRQAVLGIVAQAQVNHKDGLKIGGVQRER